MPQIAQQDYLRIPIVDITAVTDAEKEIIREKVKQGIIFDCLLFLSSSTFAKVLSVNYVDESLTTPSSIDFYDAGNEKMVSIYLFEE